MKTGKKSDNEAPLRINTQIFQEPARTVREILRRGWASSIREAVVMGLKLVEKEMLEEDLKRGQLKGVEEE